MITFYQESVYTHFAYTVLIYSPWIYVVNIVEVNLCISLHGGGELAGESVVGLEHDAAAKIWHTPVNS